MENFESKPDESSKTATTNQPKAGLLTRQELATRWNCCTHTIARRKDLKPVRLGPRLVRYRLTDIETIEAAALGGMEGAK
jgi:hypothetical protein